MGRIARATIAAVGLVGMPSWLAHADPIVLTATQMDSVTAAALVEINVPIDIRVQSNVTTQVANAVALAFASCGICTSGAPTASSLASALNINAGQQIQR